jgi:hypothetical protein
LRRQPLQPFRMPLSNGHSFGVQSPEWMLVTWSTTARAFPGESGDGDRLRLIDNSHIVNTEFCR